jgi:putative ABC transport system ATP-binding protein
VIEVEGLEKTYSAGSVTTPVLRGVGFHIERGEYTAIMGASGTGKSTLMNILGCLDKPTAGRYLLDGIDVSSLDDNELSRLRNRKIGFVFQQFHLLERATAAGNVLLPLIYAEEYPEDADELAVKALTAVGLADRVDYKPNELSGGQQQRVAVARALITDPEIILADEPTGNLDLESGLEVMSIFEKLHGQGRTIILVTHDRSVAEHAQRLIVLTDGRITEDREVEKPRDADAEPVRVRSGEDSQ